MATKTNDSWSVNFSLRPNSGDGDILVVNMSWENQAAEQVMENLNAFLSLTRAPLKVVAADSQGR